MSAPKRVVVWGTGFVGKMVIPEILRHPRFELVGVGVSNPDKVGLDVGEICGIGPIGLTAADDTEALIALQPDALVHYGPTAARADDNIRDIGAFLRAGIDVCSTAMTPWVWPAMKLNPPSWVDPITEACEAGGVLVLHDGDRSRLRQRPVPVDPGGTVQRGAPGAGPRDPRLHQLHRRLRGRDGHRAAARIHAPARAHRHPGHVVGRDDPDDGARASASSSTGSPPRGRSG